MKDALLKRVERGNGNLWNIPQIEFVSKLDKYYYILGYSLEIVKGLANLY